jgi:hypothetical protein
VTVGGSVGATTSLNSLVFGTGISNLPSGGNAGSMTVSGPVKVDTVSSTVDGTIGVIDMRTSGGLTFNGLVTTNYFQGVFQTTGNTNGTTTVTSVVGAAGLSVGQAVSGFNIASGTTITAISGTTITLSQAATGTSTGSQITPTGSQTTSFNGGATFGGDVTALGKGGTLRMGGAITFAATFSGDLNGGGPATINVSSPLTFDSSALNIPVVFGALVGSSAVVINTGTGAFTPGSYAGIVYPGSVTVNGVLVWNPANPNPTTVITRPPVVVVVPPPPPPPPPPPTAAPPPPPVETIAAPAPVATTGSAPTVVVIAAPGAPPAPGPVSAPAPSANAPQTVAETDTGGSTFASIAGPSAGPVPAPAGGTTGGQNSQGGTDGSGSNQQGSGTGTGQTAQSGTQTSTPASQGLGVVATRRIGSGPSSSPGGVSVDSSSQALNVLAAPPAVRPASRTTPAPVNPVANITQGLNQVQTPAVPKASVPGIGQNFSSSGNTSLW